ncbi:hypothetical protein HOD96_02625 [Candidatus Falkowbacteria bacterium]|jgi:hypothetical protein|nr:hypothetical protein [Candidatus Falkowbacteria bacterium]MBT4433209.1 hypothetical protein [Candidatus Falkowbacteria bacterium]
MVTCNPGQKNCPHEKVRIKKMVNVDDSGKKIIVGGKQSEFDRRFCAKQNCNTWLGDTNLRWEPILIACS